MRDWTSSNRTIRAQREAGRADVPDMPEPKPAAACPVCGGWTQAGGMSQYANGPAGCQCHKSSRCPQCAGRQADMDPDGVCRVCLDCGFTTDGD